MAACDSLMAKLSPDYLNKISISFTLDETLTSKGHTLPLKTSSLVLRSFL